MPGLKTRIVELKNKFLDSHIQAELENPLNYVADAHDLAAFRLLAHGELEDYLETKARDGLQQLEASFAAGKKTIRENQLLLVISKILKEELRFEQAFWTDDTSKVIKSAKDWISKNNGIKENSFGIISIFCGFMPDEIDSGLSASLSSYGSARGDVAHKSISRVRTLYAPSAEAKTVDDLIAELEAYFS